ncbi:hypothetical protein Q6271_27890, partial [Klebsiella pneumoniae]
GIVNARKVGILPDIGRAHQHFSEALALRSAKCLGQDFKMLSLGTTSVRGRKFTKPQNETVM